MTSGLASPTGDAKTLGIWEWGCPYHCDTGSDELRKRNYLRAWNRLRLLQLLTGPPEPECRNIMKFVARLWVLRRRGLNKLERNMYILYILHGN